MKKRYNKHFLLIDVITTGTLEALAQELCANSGPK
jgi:predicted amidophosphoribosyltransferase